MKSALERVRELNEASKDYPSVVPLMGAVLELEDRLRTVERSKQDKPSASNDQVNPNDLTKGNMQKKLHQILSSAGNKEQEVALQIHRFLSSLE